MMNDHDAKTAFETSSSPKIAVLDDDGNQAAEAWVRETTPGRWVYVDEVDGYSWIEAAEALRLSTRAIQRLATECAVTAGEQGYRVYTATDEGGVTEVIYAESWASALEQAGDWALGGDYGDELKTVRGTVTVTGPDGDERTVEWSKDPEEPQCPEGSHEWQLDEDGVWGLEGAAVSTSETCTLCGLHKTTVTGDVSTPSCNGVDYSRD